MSNNEQTPAPEPAAASESAAAPAPVPASAPLQDPPRQVGSEWLYSVEERSGSEPHNKRG